MMQFLVNFVTFIQLTFCDVTSQSCKKYFDVKHPFSYLMKQRRRIFQVNITTTKSRLKLSPYTLCHMWLIDSHDWQAEAFNATSCNWTRQNIQTMHLYEDKECIELDFRNWFVGYKAVISGTIKKSSSKWRGWFRRLSNVRIGAKWWILQRDGVSKGQGLFRRAI